MILMYFKAKELEKVIPHIKHYILQHSSSKTDENSAN